MVKPSTVMIFCQLSKTKHDEAAIREGLQTYSVTAVAASFRGGGDEAPETVAMKLRGSGDEAPETVAVSFRGGGDVAPKGNDESTMKLQSEN
ncbi:glucose-6-phosphate isomerase [Sesbania bispinosa]|nr:glucose-6-phosphate isomerase [Sesbania bispinosa]